MLRRVPIILCAFGLLGAAGCGALTDERGDPTLPATPVPTIAGVGVLPDTVPPTRQAVLMVPAPVNADGTAAALLGESVDGNRVLLIGDSILASTSSRYGGQMCDALVPLGWQAAVEAEPSRFIDFGNRVLDRVLDDDAAPADDWNAAVVFLGSNYRGDEVAYEVELRRILDRLAPRPTLLFTVTEYRSNWSEVNEVVRRLDVEYDNVTIIDWEAISRLPGVLSSDRLHPTEAGRDGLAQAVAGALGPVTFGEGDCLKSQFHDDSAIERDGGGSIIGESTGSGGSSSGSGSGSGGTRATTTTTKPTTVTTTTSPSSGGGGSGGGSGGGGGGATTTVVGGGGGATTTSKPSATTTTIAGGGANELGGGTTP